MNKTQVGWTKHYSQRIFRRGRAKYAGIVHNQLIYSGPDIKTEIVIYHYGYNLSKEKMEQKFKRTEKLLRKQLSTDKTNPFTYMNLIRVLKSQHEYKQVITHGERALKICRARMTDPIRQMIVYDMVCSFIEEGNLKEAEKRAREILEDFPDNLDMCYALGHSLIRQKRFKEAKAVFERFLEIQEEERRNPKFSLLIIDTYRFEHRVWAIIADCEYELGNYEAGVNAAKTAVKLNPSTAEYKITLARGLLLLNKKSEAKDLLKQMERDNEIDEDTYLKYAALCEKYPDLGSSVKVLRKGVDRHPDSTKLLDFFAKYVFKDDVNQAEKAWFKIYEKEPGHEGANIGLARVYIRKRDTGKLDRYKDFVIKNVNKLQVLQQLAEECEQNGLSDIAAEFLKNRYGSKPKDKKVITSSTKPTISLCMIVKDEEEFLAQCLESVKDVVDEMIIVDTGSKDRTIEIAKSYGAKVYEHPWQGSFSDS